jgi:hypothetical protein
MKGRVWMATLVVALLGGEGMLRAEPPCCQPPQDGFLKCLAPAGGWCPYGGPVLHWWPRCCFPCSGAPDDYCRKPLPKVCWPPYPPYYIWGPPETCCPQGRCWRASNETH